MTEIERKLRLLCPPDATLLGNGIPVLQGYVLTDPGELRVRQKGEAYFLTVKGDGTISRDEWESQIPEWVFTQLWPATAGHRVEKTRYSVLFQNQVLEVDQYLGSLQGLWILECEFPDLVSAGNFVLPEWAKDAVEVTADKAYKNKNLAMHGLPDGG